MSEGRHRLKRPLSQNEEWTDIGFDDDNENPPPPQDEFRELDEDEVPADEPKEEENPDREGLVAEEDQNGVKAVEQDYPDEGEKPPVLSTEEGGYPEEEAKEHYPGEEEEKPPQDYADENAKQNDWREADEEPQKQEDWREAGDEPSEAPKTRAANLGSANAPRDTYLKPKNNFQKKPSGWAPVDAQVDDGSDDEFELSTCMAPVYEGEGETGDEDPSVFKNGYPDCECEGKDIMSCFDEPNVLYRIIDPQEKTWAFYNDSTNYEVHVEFSFGKNSKLEALENTTIEQDDDGKFVTRTVVYPTETEMFVQGKVSGYTSKLRALPPFRRLP
ncbi:Domain of unknown function (DUF1935), putative [Angomonas deanei]|uniref:DUF1935 domain-containing protein n=1 Tax=Angomonas deanei TaxID=59799 RepID=A0A7G2C7W4_9TRYP|nr:Domain of unknown function (DUF1935), putative [Angomonas deanei]